MTRSRGRVVRSPCPRSGVCAIRRSSVGLGLGLSLTLTPTLHAQSAVRSVSLLADLTAADGSATVQIAIDLVSDDSAALRVQMLGFADAAADGFRAGGPDGPLIRFDERSGSREWVVIPREDLERLLVESGRLEATYVIRDAVMRDGRQVRVHVPVLTVALPPVRDVRDVFHAEIRVPHDWSVTEGFPTGLRAGPDGEHFLDLAVAPAVITLRARTDRAWRPGVPLLLDLVAGALLLAFLAVGWRHLRTTASHES